MRRTSIFFPASRMRRIPAIAAAPSSSHVHATMIFCSCTLIRGPSRSAVAGPLGPGPLMLLVISLSKSFRLSAVLSLMTTSAFFFFLRLRPCSYLRFQGFRLSLQLAILECCLSFTELRAPSRVFLGAAMAFCRWALLREVHVAVFHRRRVVSPC